MRISILVVLSLISLHSFAATNYKMATVCKLSLKDQFPFFESEKKEIEKILADVRKSVIKQKAFKDSDMYEWLRFTSPDTLGSLLAVMDVNSCTGAYSTLIHTTVRAAYDSALTTWKNCILSNYRNAVPDMAERLLLCHGVLKSDLEPEEKAPPEDDAD